MDKVNSLLVYRRAALILLVSTSVVWLPFALSTAYATAGPAVLLPSGVRTDLERTKERTEEMEEQLGPLIGELQTQFDTYNEMDCDGASDEGCQQIAQNVGRKYGELLDHVDNGLREVEPMVQRTLNELGKRLYSEVGLKMAPRDIQKYLAEHGAGPTAAPGPRRGGVAATFKRLLDMFSSSQNRQSPMLLSSEIHLDLSEALNYIQLTRAEVENQKIVQGVQDGYFSRVDEQMISTVQTVKTLVFGPAEDGFGDIPPPFEPPETRRGSRWEQ